MTGTEGKAGRIPIHLAIPATYAAIGAAYILGSTWFFRGALNYSEAIAETETLKGLAFVGVTAAALWLLLWQLHRRRTLGEITFRQLIENMQDAVLLLEMPARRILYANPAACRLWGYEESELVGSGSEKLHVSPEHHRRFGELIAPALERNDVFRGDYELRRKDGTVFPSGHTLSFFRDPGGRSHAVGITRDRTSIQKYISTIRDSEDRFREVVENMNEVFWISDPEKTRMEYVSPAYARIWGGSVDALYSNPRAFLEAIVPEDRERVAEEVARQSSGRYDVQYRIRRPDGEQRWIRDRAVPIRDEAGRVIRIVGFAEDITEFKKRESELLQSQKMEAIGQLTGGLAHDFNNMLMVIMANAESLAESFGNDASRRTQATGIVQAGERAADLITRLLAFARAQPLRVEACDLNALVEETADLLARAIGSNIAIEKSLAPDLWPVAADRTQLETSIINLVTNARDAMPSGGRLIITSENRTLGNVAAEAIGEIKPGDYVVLSMSDTGSGMSPEIAAHIFEPFFTTKEPGKGTGLGLPMIYGFVKQSGGQVQVESSPGKGTTFRLFLPRHRGGEVVQGTPLPKLDGGRETVLVAEDDPMVRQLVSSQLRSLGYAVIEARDGPSALNQLECQNDVALLFSDVIMPGGMDGAELAQRAVALRPGLRVLLTSGYGDVDALQRLGETGDPVDWPVLRKPYARGELASAVRRALESTR